MKQQTIDNDVDVCLLICMSLLGACGKWVKRARSTSPLAPPWLCSSSSPRRYSVISNARLGSVPPHIIARVWGLRLQSFNRHPHCIIGHPGFGRIAGVSWPILALSNSATKLLNARFQRCQREISAWRRPHALSIADARRIIQYWTQKRARSSPRIRSRE